jgi:hypothetical protein
MTQEIIDIIKSGDVDEDLRTILNEVRARMAIKGGQKRAEDQFMIGQWVEVVTKLRPNYLFGHQFQIVKLNEKTVCVEIPDEAQYRRFRNMRSLRLPKGAVRVVG